MLALVIVNWDYVGNQFDELMYPEQDGEVMEKTLDTAGFKHVKVVQNISDIESCVRRYKAENQLEEIERFHFHYSGRVAGLPGNCHTGVYQVMECSMHR